MQQIEDKHLHIPRRNTYICGKYIILILRVNNIFLGEFGSHH